MDNIHPVDGNTLDPTQATGRVHTSRIATEAEHSVMYQSLTFRFYYLID